MDHPVAVGTQEGKVVRFRPFPGLQRRYRLGMVALDEANLLISVEI